MGFLCRKLIHQQQGSYAIFKVINNLMHKDDHDLGTANTDETQQKPRVDEAGSVNVSGYVKVFDPNTNEILVESRE